MGTERSAYPEPLNAMCFFFESRDIRRVGLELDCTLFVTMKCIDEFLLRQRGDQQRLKVSERVYATAFKV